MNESPKLMMASRATLRLEFEDFKEDIDDHRGYLQGLAKSVKCFFGRIGLGLPAECVRKEKYGGIHQGK